ncbi:lysine decarboxylase 1 [Klebsiella pneumoniae]|uniref:Lysine decarboxylase 1 n=1 Tax=Klebsiella pneumoniae TaxID=573 RepID=A0A377TPN7_KLEPN|nr:lysine decarboxylase 1 [Klebsiella pneumoniae]
MMMSDITPIYFRPTRNAYGILGGIPQSEFQHATIAKRCERDAECDLAGYTRLSPTQPMMVCCYNTDFIKKNPGCEIHPL